MQSSGAFVLQCIALASAVARIQGHAVEGVDYEQTLTDVNIEERDALYPIARYAGMGYNLLQGNPEDSFKRGGIDPGIKSTRWIFNLTMQNHKEHRYNDKTVIVPDQIEFQPLSGCISRSSQYTGQTSYQRELQNNIENDFSGMVWTRVYMKELIHCMMYMQVVLI